MAEKIQTTPLLQAALSHYRAKRDKHLAELDIYLNKPVGVGEHATVVDEVIKLFADLDNADSVIETIEGIIYANQPYPPSITVTNPEVPTTNNQESQTTENL
jgi:hypothetical protein